jgi:hypothetical protein
MPGLRVQVERRPLTDELDVYIYESGENTVHRLWRYDTGYEPGPSWRVDEVEPGALPVEPSLRIPIAIAEILSPELLEIARPSTAQGRHLDDAIAVRDRLLAMVEGTFR